MKTAFLFSGQGSQSVGMGKELYDTYEVARTTFDQVKLDFDVKKLCFEGPQEQLNDTAYAQACIFTMSMAVAAILREKGVEADVCAGLSLGEYSAYAYAHAFSIEDGANIVRERGKLMAHSLPEGSSSMAAILMLDEAKIKEACAKASSLGVCEIANYNCPGQIVITGSREAVAQAGEYCKELGARRVVPLAVSGAFHSSLLQEASQELHNVLERYEVQANTIPVYNNTSGSVETAPVIDILTKQICHSVYFEQTIYQMLEDGVTRFIEVGPGSAVSAFVKKCAKAKAGDVEILHVEDEASLQATLQAIGE